MPGNNLSLSKIITTLSKTLDSITQIIPLYREAKPLLNNLKSSINIIKDWGTKTSSNIVDNKNIKNIRKKVELIKNINNPTFFQ